jgi:hypothetical protein
MVRRRHHFDSVVFKVAKERAPAETSDAVADRQDSGKYCAYNQTRKRFVGSQIDAEDLSVAHIDARLPALAQRSGEGLWLLPFRGISPTSVRNPLDLVYLDRDCAVLETVESFPIFSASDASSAAASVLVLPADTIRSTGTQPGDRLILCAPAEMKQRLQKLASPDTEVTPVAGAEEPAVSTVEVSAHSGTGRLLHWEDHSKLRNSGEGSPVADGAQAKILVEEPAPQKISEDRPQDKIFNQQLAQEKLPEIARPSEKVLEAIRVPEVPPVELKPSAPEAPKPAEHESEEKSAKPAKSWLQRLLNPEPPQPRKALRESLSGLTAYFFTGGAPVAHAVRDISKTGMYVFTAERWYPGTVVRMTLTDSLQPTAEHSITLNMAVMRCGNDGVGLQFVTRPDQSRWGKQAGPQDMMSATADERQIEQFLQRFRRE